MRPSARHSGRTAPDENLPSGALRPLVWIGSSKEDLSGLPPQVKASFGVRLFELQQGKTPLDMKPLTQFGGGVYELRDSFDTNAYRWSTSSISGRRSTCCTPS